MVRGELALELFLKPLSGFVLLTGRAVAITAGAIELVGLAAFRPSAYDEVFNLCLNHLAESFKQLKAKNLPISHWPGEPYAEFGTSVDMLGQLFKSIGRAPRFPWKVPAFWLSLAILYFLFRDPYGSILWWLVLLEAILMIGMTWAANS
jgi:hypothetical protein